MLGPWKKSYDKPDNNKYSFVAEETEKLGNLLEVLELLSKH